MVSGVQFVFWSETVEKIRLEESEENLLVAAVCILKTICRIAENVKSGGFKPDIEVEDAAGYNLLPARHHRPVVQEESGAQIVAPENGGEVHFHP